MTVTPNKAISTKELLLIEDTSFLLTKARIIEKIEALLSNTRKELYKELQKSKLDLPVKKTLADGKIFRGENYRLLPYMLLDYPRHFSKDSVCAMRTMFWWGNEFSCTLHLQGNALEQYRDRLIGNSKLLNKKDLFICVYKGPWEYHFKKDNYVSISSLGKKGLDAILKNKDFIKISRRMELKKWKALPLFAKESFLFYSALLS